MIIVGQDKTDLINFDNVSWLYVEPNNSTINVALKYGDSISIAEYKTLKRAKEVLKKIIEFYEVSKRYECSSNNGITLFMQKTFVYEMPEK